MTDTTPSPLPPTQRLYLLDTYRVSLPDGARVLAVLEEPDAKTPDVTRTAVVLDRTIFHPQGGGQPADQGTITLLRRECGDGGSVAFAVESVRDDGAGVLRHYGSYVGDVVEGFTVGDEVALQVRRWKNERIWTCTHSNPSIDLLKQTSTPIPHRSTSPAAASTRACTPRGTPWTWPWPGSGWAGSA